MIAYNNHINSIQKGYMECHVGTISSDWILIYKIDKTKRVLKLARTGTHAELFG
ncbi:MAG: type II toxin-antitoxin system mRNA interferase toxin, RelE/StbE family [Acidobacteria bacterium]|nr:type II toxin-antitoxin system mRNA interferase toxin, RelE/StbE family [Acidobacteriota bacterium]